MLSAIALIALVTQLAVARADTVHGAIIFSRHGDRNWKGDPPTRLTTIGQNQLYNSGAYWRSRYLNSSSDYRISGISKGYYDAVQLSASAPDQPLLVTSGQAFLQGLYPPTLTTEVLANGTTVHAPLSGYQYAPLTTVPTDSPATIWLKGDNGCPAYDDLSAKWNSTSQYKALEESTKNFYLSFYDRIFAGVLPKSKLSYANAYTIFDYVNVGMVHNETIANTVSEEELFQLRTLADSEEWAQNDVVSSADDARGVSGRTIAGKLLQQLEAVTVSKGTKNMLSVNIISYNAFLAFFGLTHLPSISGNFYGIPDYASVLVFEMFSNSETFPEEKDLYVRFLFRNGTENGDAQIFRLFGDNKSMSWSDFKAAISKISIDSVAEWCTFCGSSEGICLQYNLDKASRSAEAHVGKMEPAVAGVIGAVVTLGMLVFATIIAVMAGIRISKRSKQLTAAIMSAEKVFDDGNSYSRSK